MATNSLNSKTQGHVIVNMIFKDFEYDHVKLSALPNLCTEVVLGDDFLKNHEKVEIPFNGTRTQFSVCNLVASKVVKPTLFPNLTLDCKLIATKSRRRSPEADKFISSEIQRLIREKVIEPSQFPWRAQLIITTNERHKKNGDRLQPDNQQIHTSRCLSPKEN